MSAYLGFIYMPDRKDKRKDKQHYYVVVKYHNTDIRRLDCKDDREVRHYFGVLQGGQNVNTSMQI